MAHAARGEQSHPAAAHARRWCVRPLCLRCSCGPNGASDRARRAVRVSRGRRSYGAAHAADDALCQGRRRDRRTARARPVRKRHAAARRPGDLRGPARRWPDLAARGLRLRTRPVERRAAGRGRDHAGGRAGRPLRAAAGGQARRSDRRGCDRRALRRRREGDHAAVHRHAGISQRGRDKRRPGADGRRPGGDDERGQLLRRRRRPGGRRVRDHRAGDDRDRVRPRPRSSRACSRR